MKITVCSLHNGGDAFTADWAALVEHVKAARSGIVLLPEMPFAPWFPVARHYDERTWNQAIAAHDAWEQRLSALAPALVLGTRPVNFADLRYSAGFCWNRDEDIDETLHLKSRLSNEAGAWESGWYEQAATDPEVATVDGISIGMLIGAELWVPGQAKQYVANGAHLLAVPRAGIGSEDAWLATGRDAARTTATCCIGSTRGIDADSIGGSAWIIAADGRVVAKTSIGQPFVTADVPLAVEAADPRVDVAPWNRL